MEEKPGNGTRRIDLPPFDDGVFIQLDCTTFHDKTDRHYPPSLQPYIIPEYAPRPWR